MVLPTLVRQALEGQPITVHGTGEQRRCFAYVGDVAEVLVRLAQTPEAAGQIVNVGNDQEVSMNELAALVKEVTGSPSPVQHVSYGEAYGPGFEDMPQRVPCLKKLESLVRYRPTTALDAIVRRVVDYEWTRLSKRTLAAAV
jgi:UDP-glucose 4-epimerase